MLEFNFLGDEFSALKGTPHLFNFACVVTELLERLELVVKRTALHWALDFKTVDNTLSELVWGLKALFTLALRAFFRKRRLTLVTLFTDTCGAIILANELDVADLQTNHALEEFWRFICLADQVASDLNLFFLGLNEACLILVKLTSVRDPLVND